MLNTLNIHRLETGNIGDLVAAPVLYFEELAKVERLDILGNAVSDQKQVDTWYDKVRQAEAIIVGGGGLLAMEKFEGTLKEIIESGKKVIVWGAGNNKGKIDSLLGMRVATPPEIAKCTLAGTRDAGAANWVPCASAMSPLFSKQYEITRDVVFFANKAMAGNSSYIPRDFPKSAIMGNMNHTMDEIVAFLGSANTVVTSSYHGAYWATLLGRKVVGIPTSSKFYSLHHPVPLSHPADWQRFMKLARSYPDALEECRAANRTFFTKVMDELTTSVKKRSLN